MKKGKFRAVEHENQILVYCDTCGDIQKDVSKIGKRHLCEEVENERRVSLEIYWLLDSEIDELNAKKQVVPEGI